jgi:competence protein ComGC
MKARDAEVVTRKHQIGPAAVFQPVTKRVEPLVHENADNQPSLSVLITDGALKATQRSQFSGSNARRVGYIA